MQMKAWAIALSGLVAIAVVGGIAFTLWLNTSTGGPGEQYVFPITWTPALDPDDVVSADTAITLQENGTATLTGIALGRIKTSNGQSCVSPSGGLYSGKATWTLDENGFLQFDAVAGVALLAPVAARFEGVDWGSLRQQMCDGDVSAYEARTDPVG